MNKLDKDNLEFINWTLKYEGTESLKSWFHAQEAYVQDYVIDLLKKSSMDVVNLTDELTEDLSAAKSLLSKFSLAKI